MAAPPPARIRSTSSASARASVGHSTARELGARRVLVPARSRSAPSTHRGHPPARRQSQPIIRNITDETSGGDTAGVVVRDDQRVVGDAERSHRIGKRRRRRKRVTSLGGGVIGRGQLIVEIDPHCTGDVTGLEGGARPSRPSRYHRTSASTASGCAATNSASTNGGITARLVRASAVASANTSRSGRPSCRCDRCGVVVLDLHPTERNLGSHRVAVDDDLAFAALLRPASQFGATQTQRAGLAQQQRPDAAARRTDHTARAPCVRDGPSSSRSARPTHRARLQRSARRSCERSLRRWRRRRWSPSSCTRWPGSGITLVASASPITTCTTLGRPAMSALPAPYPTDEHVDRRHRAELVGQRAHQRHAGGRGQLLAVVDATARRVAAGEQFGDRWRRVRQAGRAPPSPCPRRR